ncbi:efflux RND transporter periplasmic adaptor subunit [Aurantibacillus circumpalustris]|uniref:efflux RND transporter periplasmic adaptor subunit n=1 Tax=Aurantibacillus circumpalustris TaxID=3036359 RepID=UPI00295B5B4F|nr:efflux RND transporter periplasmic adaptor subunit [Aurantibacillus circumpalustris]
MKQLLQLIIYHPTQIKMKNYILGLVTVFLFSCGNPTIPEQESENKISTNTITLTDAQFKSAKIQVGKLVNKTISSTIKVNGIIDVPPQNMVSVSMPLGGYLKTTKLLPGMHVGKGEVIATMEDLQYIQLQQEYLTVKSKLDFVTAEYNRQKELNESKATSDKLFQQAQMEYETQCISLSALAEKLKLINIDPKNLSENNLSKAVNIYSPIDGFVSKVNVNIGKYVNPSDILFELVNPSDIHLNLKVFERDLEKLYIGQKLVAYNNNQPDKKHPCEIILIGKDISLDRTAEIHCHFEDYDKTLLPGMYMNAEIEIQLKNTETINSDAIVSYEGKDYVFIVLKTGTFEMREIKKGVSESHYTGISFIDTPNVKDLKIVTQGAYTLLMELKNKEE